MMMLPFIICKICSFLSYVDGEARITGYIYIYVSGYVFWYMALDQWIKHDM